MFRTSCVLTKFYVASPVAGSGCVTACRSYAIPHVEVGHSEYVIPPGHIVITLAMESSNNNARRNRQSVRLTFSAIL